MSPLTETPYADVRPAWAHACGCKSRRELVTTSEVKRNCVRATERGKEAWSVNREPMNKNFSLKFEEFELGVKTIQLDAVVRPPVD